MLELESKKVERGIANKGLYFWKIHDEGRACFQFVEKVIKRDSIECAFYQQVQKSRLSAKVPLNVYWLTCADPEQDDVCSAFLDYYPGAGEFSIQDARGDLEVLAKNICSELSDLGRFCSSLAALELPDRSNLLSRYLSAYKGQPTDLFLKLKDVDDVYRRAIPLGPKVVSHNDLHFHNMWVNDQLDVRLIDFGLLGLNSPGADLHHFYAIAARGTETDKQFYDLLVDQMARMHDSQPEVIKISACYYAIHRMASRLKLGQNAYVTENKKIFTLIDDFFLLTAI